MGAHGSGGVDSGDHIKDLVHRQSTTVDPGILHEMPEFYWIRWNRRAAKRVVAHWRSSKALEIWFQSSVTLLAMAAILIPYGIMLPVALFLSTLPALYVVMRFDRKYHRWWQASTTNRRWSQYYDMVLTNAYCAPEVRLFGLGQRLRESYQGLRRELRGERLKQMQKQSLARLLAGVAALLVASAAMVWMGWRATAGSRTLGDLALFYQTFSRGQGLGQGLLSNLGRIYTHSLFLGNLFKFLELKPQICSPADPHPYLQVCNTE